MRDKLNENPVAQIALIALLALVGGYMVLGQMGGGGSSKASTEASAEVESAEPVAATSAVSAPVAKRMPAKVESAYRRGDTIVLLVYRRGGIDDAFVAAASAEATSMPHVAFFDTSTAKIAAYSAITGPVGVSRAPALVVIRARKHGGGGPAPATVTYGYQGPDEVRQAIIDAGYTGPEPSYAPS
jgi:hypothetical protein